MIIESIAAENFKCFYDEQTIELKKGFNLFIGKNNSGKTTILELLDLAERINDPHKSESSMEQYNQPNNNPSKLKLKVSTTIDELKRIFNGDFHIPLPSNLGQPISIDRNKSAIEAKLIEDQKICIRYIQKSNILEAQIASIFGVTEFLNAKNAVPGIHFKFPKGHNSGPDTTINSQTPSKITNLSLIKSCFYRFSPMRNPRSQHSMNSTEILDSDAANLAYCINHIQTNDAEGHKELCELINRVFPEVNWIQSPPINQNGFELRCLKTPPHKRRDDLAVPLNKMGSGIGNVIAILYVVLTSRFPQVIAIDEPNSFLHPKALRELLQILSTYGKRHQYILTGHSPDVLTAVDPSTISHFDLINSATKVKQFTQRDFHEFRSELSDLGIRMTDLHAKDRILWVEGQTEEILLPILLSLYCKEIASETAVLRVTNTGAFSSKKTPIDDIARTYQRLSATSLAPPMIAILLDKEGRNKNTIGKISRNTDGLLNFLPYRMIENYTLVPEAISAILSDYNINYDEKKIELAIESIESIEDADGAKILKEIFEVASDSSLEFRKTTHTPELFKWIIDNKPEHLHELKTFIRKMCKLNHEEQ